MARKIICLSGKEAYITNILADGTERDDMAGYEMPYNEKFYMTYEAIMSISNEKINSNSDEKIS